MITSELKYCAEFNEDVVENILRYLYFRQLSGQYNPYEPDWSSLASYSRISRAWRRPAQRLLFHYLYLRSIKKYKWFCTSDALRRNPPLTWIRILELWIGPDYLDISQIANVTSQIPYLYEMRLKIHGNISVTPDICQRLAKTTPIVSLRIKIFTGPGDVQGSLSLLQVEWPLRHLEIRGYQVYHDPFADMLPPFSPRYELQEFRIFGMIRWNEILPWATRNSWGSLKVLHMPIIEVPPGVPSSLPPRLQSLYLSGIAWQLPVIEASELSELILDMNYTLDWVTLFQELPPNVRHLGITIMGKEGVSDIFNHHINTIIGMIPIVPIYIETISLYTILDRSESCLSPFSEVTDSRFRIVEICDTFPDMVEYRGRPMDDHWGNMRAMNQAVLGVEESNGD